VSRARGRAGIQWAVRTVPILSIFLVLASPTTAWAQALATPPEKADCERRLALAEKAVEHDAYYAHAWTDTWYWVGTSLVILNVTQAFQSGDYKRGESLTFAASSLLLMIQRPLALTSKDALQALRTSSVQDPCLALADATSILTSNKVDGEMHRAWPIYVINAGFNLAVMGVLAAVTHHWDFAGHSDLGLNTLVGIAMSELQVATYPSGSLKTVGTSLELSF
jgi:hypothetical protein